MTRQFKKQIQNQSQKGRSMIEMLGVLAIIAILSIGGIVGYKLAMNYYQADQIANEINLMRNDLKVKYALGNEELLLGDPYDDTPENEHYSGHLSTQYDHYPVDYDCIRKDKAEFYNCRETDAYYIKVGNVSKGVCKPLTTLLNGMDGLMYIEINNEVYKEDDLCSSDENNEIYIEFDAEEVNGNYDSNRPDGWCADDDDCEGLSTPVCDKENNTCVECVKEGDCSAPRSVCDVANHECVECIENADCPTNKPVCNIDLGNCESCPPEKPIWYNNTCVECTVNEDCLEKGTDKPICNSDTYTCEACPEDQPWNGEFCGCLTNNDCESDEFCLTSDCYCICGDDTDAYRSGTTTEKECCTDKPHKCVKVSEYTAPNLDSNDSPYIMSNIDMNWWSAERFCQALPGSKHMLEFSDLDCCGTWDGITNNHCYAKGDTCSSTNGISHVIKKLRKAENGSEDQGSYWYWLEDPYTEANKGRNSCAVYTVVLISDAYGVVSQNRGNYHPGNGEHHALCW